MSQVEQILKEASQGRVDFNEHQEIEEAALKFQLDDKSREPFDQDVFEQLVERMKEIISSNPRRVFNWRLFAEVLVEAEDVLKRKIQEVKEKQTDCQRSKEQVVNRLNDIRATELLNKYNISFDSQLQVTVQTVSLSQLGVAKPYVKLSLGNGAAFQTSIQQGNEVSFNASFAFSVTTGQESLEIAVFNSGANNSLIGNLTIPLSLLRDQTPKQLSFDILGQDRKKSGQIRLLLQWIFSREIPVQAELADWDAAIDKINSEMMDYKHDLQVIYLPFRDYAQMSDLLKQTNKNNQFYQAPPSGQQNHQQEQQQQQIQLLAEGKQPDLDADQKYSKIPLEGNELNGFIEVKQETLRLATILFSAFLFCTLLSHLFRPQFLDCLISLSALLFFELKMFDSKRAQIILISLFISIILDFFWLYLNSAGWWQSYTDDIDIPVVNSGERKFTVIISYIAFLLKFPLAFALFKLLNELKSNPPQANITNDKLLQSFNFNRTLPPPQVPSAAANAQQFSRYQQQLPLVQSYIQPYAG